MVLLALYERLTGTKLSKRSYVAVFVVGFLTLAFFTAWRDQWVRANAAELALKTDKPDFELTYGTVMVSGMDVTNDNGTIDRYAAVFLPVRVFNHGAPSVIRGWKLLAKLNSGEVLQGVPYGAPGPTVRFPSPKGNMITVPTSSSLFRQGTITPIPEGGQADGFVLFQFPAQYTDMMKQKGTVLTLEIEDVTRRPYRQTITLTGTEATDYYASPSMQP